MISMPELNQIYQKQLDQSQLCPVCQAAMYWIEAEYHHQALNFHQCSHCQHRLYYGEQTPTCHCTHCLQQRQQAIQATRFQERKQLRLKQKQQNDSLEIPLQQLRLVEKLFLLSLLDGVVDERCTHAEFIDFSKYYPLNIAPSYQLFKQLKNSFISQDYLLSYQQSEQQFFPNLRLHGYREPSLLSLTQQLRDWFYRDFTKAVPYKDPEEVKDTIVILLSHELINYCQYCCQKWQILFYANQQFVDYCKTLLQDLAPTQIFFLIQRGLSYLHQSQLLEASNHNYVNTNRLRKTLQGYRERGQQQAWETGNLPRPVDLSYAQMNFIFFERFLKLDQKIFMQPLWKCWQQILPRLRFFGERHCIHCGSKDLAIDYSTNDYVSLTCLRCKQQDHYFVG
jgi:hypothetical protein